jgi:hypothetical protein
MTRRQRGQYDRSIRAAEQAAEGDRQRVSEAGHYSAQKLVLKIGQPGYLQDVRRIST